MTDATPCAHCGLDCGNTPILEKELPFCCLGCQTVHGILHEAGLGTFYAIESRPGLRPADSPAANRFAFLDDDSIRPDMLDFFDGRNARVTFHVPGIHCLACVWLLERLHKIDPRVGRSEVHFPLREVSVQFDMQDIPLSEIAALIDGLGYVPDLHLATTHDKARKTPADRARRRLFLQLGVAGFCFGNVMMLSFPGYLGLGAADSFSRLFGGLSLLLAIPALLFSGVDYLRSAWTGLRQRHLTIDLPIAIGMLALFVQSSADVLRGTGEGYFDSLTGLVFFLLIGKWFQLRGYDAMSFDRDFRSYFPLCSRRLEAGVEHSVPIQQLEQGDVIRVRDGELIPVDATNHRGPAEIDYSFVTGESMPVQVPQGERIFAGGRQRGPVLELTVLKKVSQSYLTSLWNAPAFTRSSDRDFTRLTDRFSRWFTAAVLLVAAATGLFWWRVEPAVALRAATAVLIVACPCALALSAPFALGNVLRILARNRFFAKNTETVERMAKVSRILFDKTGTLTERQVVVEAVSGQLDANQRSWVKTVVSQSAHPVSQSLVSFLPGDALEDVSDYMEFPGQGVSGVVDQRTIRTGRRSWIDPSQTADAGDVLVEIDDELMAGYRMVSQPRPGMEALLDRLRTRYGVGLLSGDQSAHVADFASRMAAGELAWQGEQSPHDKLHAVERLQASGATVCMCGDGLNDAGALKQSDVGIAVTDDVHAFTPACDAILDANRLAALDRFFAFARAGMRVVGLSIALSVLYNLVGVTLAAGGNLSPLFAAVLMPVSSISVMALALAGTWWMARRCGLEVGR